MNQDHPGEDAYEQRLAEWEDRLERGDAVEETTSGDSSEMLDAKLHKGLACLKQLNNLRRRSAETPISQRTRVAEVSFTPVKYKLPCRFGKFDLLSELGRGGFGVVFLALDRVLDCQVALKMPHTHVLTNVSLRERFVREARVAAGLQHSNIVAVHEAGEVGPVNYIVYAFCPGITLAEWMRIQKDQIQAQQAADWVACLAEAVAFAHSKGVLHRDLKPANVLLQDPMSNGSTIVVGAHRLSPFIPKITDFGLAKLEREKQQTATGAILGTPTYMAPEQATAKGPIGPAVDIHALGVILYEMLAGQPPYRGENDYETLQLVSKQEPLPLRKHRPKLSRDLETICLKCLQKDPTLRYASASDLSADLRRYLAGQPIHARPVSVVEHSWRICRRHPLVSGLVIALFLALVGGVATFLYQNHYRGLQAEATKAWLQKYLEFLRTNVQASQEMLKDVRTERQGREKLISLIPYYEALLNEAQTEPSLQIEAARLASQAGSIHHSLAELDKAIARYLQSIELLEQVRKRQGHSYELIEEQSTYITRLAFAYRHQGKWADSERTYRSAMKQMQDELARQPENTRILAFLSNALVYNAYNLQKQSRGDEAEQDLLLAMKHIEKALSIKPDDDNLVLTQAVVMDELGQHYMNKKRMNEAESSIHQALAIRQRLFDRNPKMQGLASVLARSHWRLGQFSWKMGRRNDAEEQYLISIKMNDQLMVENPDSPGIAHNAAWDRIILCDLLEEFRRYNESEKYIREALAIRTKCLAEFPQHEDNQYELVTMKFRLAKALRAQGKRDEAETVYQDGLTSHERLIGTFPHDVKIKEGYANRLQTLAKLYEDDHQPDKALAAGVNLMKAREKLVESFPEVVSYKRELDGCYGKLAGHYRKKADWEHAAQMSGRAIPVRQQICANKEATPKDRHTLAQREYAHALDLVQLQQHEKALVMFASSAELEEALLVESYRSAGLELELATIRLQEGNAHFALKRYQAAHQGFSKACTVIEPLYMKEKNKAQLNLLTICHYALFRTSWQASYDVCGAIKHYAICNMLSPTYCNWPVHPYTVIRRVHGWVKGK